MSQPLLSQRFYANQTPTNAASRTKDLLDEFKKYSKYEEEANGEGKYIAVKDGITVVLKGTFKNGNLTNGPAKIIWSDAEYHLDFTPEFGLMKGRIINPKNDSKFEGTVEFEKGLFFPPSPMTGKSITSWKEQEDNLITHAEVTWENGQRTWIKTGYSGGGLWEGTPPDSSGKVQGHFINPKGECLLPIAKSAREVYEGEAVFIGSKLQRHGKSVQTMYDEKDQELEKFEGEWEHDVRKEGKYFSKSSGISFRLHSDAKGVRWIFDNGAIWEGDTYTHPSSSILSLSHPLVGKEVYNGGAILHSANGGTVLKHGKGIVRVFDDKGEEMDSLDGEWETGVCVRGHYKSRYGSDLKIQGEDFDGVLVNGNEKITGEWKQGQLYKATVEDLTTGSKEEVDYSAHFQECTDPSHHHHHHEHDHHCSDPSHHHHHHHHHHHEHDHHGCSDPSHHH